jgi:predicted enzyme related to lactoylglutathione lyase
MAGKLVHFEVPAKDTGRAKGFYTAVFGWEFGEGMPGMDYSLTEAGGEPGGAVYTHEEMSPHIFVYFDTDDIDASVAKVRESGGEAKDKAPIPSIGWFSHCKDTEGNIFGLFQSDESAPPPESS